jgi:AcrR family transcriptional regulator
MKRTKEDANKTKQSILDAAIKVFSQKGYAGTRFDDIAKEAGVTRGAVTWHFSNKANLLKAALDGAMKAYGERLQHILNTNLSPLNTIRALVKEMLSSLETDPSYRTSMEIIVYKAELSEELQQGWDEYVTVVQRFQRDFERLIQKGIMAGEIRPEIDPYLVALSMTAFVIGIEQLWLMDSKAFSVVEVSDRVVDFLTKGIIPS